jgi:ferredoxin
MNKKKVVPMGLSALLVLPILTGCSNQTAVQVEENQDSDNDAPETVSQNQEVYLVVDPNKCIGCGKCVKFDPSHFLMDNDIRKSIVISQSDLDSSSLSSAVSICPVDAITL